MDSDAFALEYRLRASPAEVWRHLTAPQLLDRWYWPSRLRPVYEADAVQGGPFRFSSAVANIGVSGTYLEVDPPRRLKKSWCWEGAGEETTVRVSIDELEEGETLLTLVHSGHEDEASLENHRTGWTDCLNRLRELVG